MISLRLVFFLCSFLVIFPANKATGGGSCCSSISEDELIEIKDRLFLKCNTYVLSDSDIHQALALIKNEKQQQKLLDDMLDHCLIKKLNSAALQLVALGAKADNSRIAEAGKKINLAYAKDLLKCWEILQSKQGPRLKKIIKNLLGGERNIKEIDLPFELPRHLNKLLDPINSGETIRDVSTAWQVESVSKRTH